MAAWSFNRAIYLFGQTMESDLANAGSRAKNEKQANLKRQQVMNAWLGTPVKFRDPATKATGQISSDKASGQVQL